MNLKKHLANLREILAELYPDESSIRRIIDDSGIDSTRIDLSSAPINNWHAILTYANKTNKVVTILDIAENEYKTNNKLRNASTDYRRAIGRHTRNNAEGTFPHESSLSNQKNLPWASSIDDEEWEETSDQDKVVTEDLPSKKSIVEATHIKKGKRVTQATAKYQLANPNWSEEIYNSNHFLGEYGLNVSPSNAWNASIENTGYASVIEIWIESAENHNNSEPSKLLLAIDQPTKEFVKNRYSFMDKYDVIVAEQGLKGSLIANKLTLDYKIIKALTTSINVSQGPTPRALSVFLSVIVEFSVWYQA